MNATASKHPPGHPMVALRVIVAMLFILEDPTHEQSKLWTEYLVIIKNECNCIKTSTWTPDGGLRSHCDYVTPSDWIPLTIFRIVRHDFVVLDWG